MANQEGEFVAIIHRREDFAGALGDVFGRGGSPYDHVHDLPVGPATVGAKERLSSPLNMRCPGWSMGLIELSLPPRIACRLAIRKVALVALVVDRRHA